ncbi:MAG: RNA polymerase sigma-70 factor [Candidatus Cryptobacteroides sp.]
MVIEEFSKLYECARDKLERIACSYTGDMEVARDIVMEVFVGLWEKRPDLDQLNIDAYLYSSVRNRCISWLRHKKSVNQFNNDSSRDQENRNYYSYTPEINALVSKALNSMPELTSKVFLLSREEALSYSQIALRLGISHRKVTSEMQRALKILRQTLADFR